LQPSAIREILKVTADPSVISFAAGNPSPEAFPSRELAELAAGLFASGAASALQYGVSEGYAPLREITAARLREKFGIGSPDDDLIIVSGGQQGVELTAKVLLNEGDTVVCEEPSFIGALNAFRSYGVKLAGVPCGERGMDMDALAQRLSAEPRPKLIYTIPTFQNPTGATMPAERRRLLVELAARFDVPLLEDDPYRELRYEGEDAPALKSLDTGGRVIYCGSFSKVIAPGIRLGYICAPKGLMQKLIVAKQVSDVHSNLFFQALVCEYIKRYDIDAHIGQIRSLYRRKRDLMASLLHKQFSFTLPQGGLFIWAELPQGLDGFEYCRRAAAKKVAAVPGASFLTDERAASRAIRLNFSLPSFGQIEQGCALLGEALCEYMG
jgi:2-aminoadipate transaminase